MRNVCFIAPAQFLHNAVDRFRADHPDYVVRSIDYVESSELRRARSQGALPAELEATAPALTDADRAALAEAEALIVLDLPSGALELAPNLRYVQAFGAGIEWLVPRGFAERGIVFANASGVSSDSIAEFVMARLLQIWKDLRRVDEQQVRHEWRPRWATEVGGRTLGVVSLGAIGRATAVRARAFGMQVLASRRTAGPGDTDPDVDGLYGLDRLDELLGQCDAVLVSAPATAETADLFDAGRFAAMKPGAVFCNVSRGSLVDEDALVASLRAGHLGAAVLDVVKDEPAPPDHRLWDEPGVYLSPHCSASFDRYNDRLLVLFADNLARLSDGRPLINVVDAALGY